MSKVTIVSCVQFHAKKRAQKVGRSRQVLARGSRAGTLLPRARVKNIYTPGYSEKESPKKEKILSIPLSESAPMTSAAGPDAITTAIGVPAADRQTAHAAPKVSQLGLLEPDRAEQLAALWAELEWYGAKWQPGQDPVVFARRLIARYGDSMDCEAESQDASLWLMANPARRKRHLGRYLYNWLRSASMRRAGSPKTSSNSVIMDQLSDDDWLYGCDQ